MGSVLTTGSQNRGTRPSAIQGRRCCDGHFYWAVCPWCHYGCSYLPPEDGEGCLDRLQPIRVTGTSRTRSIRKCLTTRDKIAGLANIASNYLIAGKEAHRHGTAHPSIVPYQVFPCKDGYIMIGAGNDKQVYLVFFTLLYSYLDPNTILSSNYLPRKSFVNPSCAMTPNSTPTPYELPIASCW
jgi:CoA-transferase family III